LNAEVKTERQARRPALGSGELLCAEVVALQFIGGNLIADL